MSILLPQQSRGARGLLNWTQSELAKAATVGLSTIKNFESERRETTPANVNAIRRALEDAGVVFVDDGKFAGVKLKLKRGK
jgi:transcriptional regulator with XRE-family HTH domain